MVFIFYLSLKLRYSQYPTTSYKKVTISRIKDLLFVYSIFNFWEILHRKIYQNVFILIRIDISFEKVYFLQKKKILHEYEINWSSREDFH